jgi:dipeptidyl aminopeptidase/acylaminoacyl peptidase
MFAQSPSPSSAKHPFTFEDMMKLKRVGAPVPSPDGKWVVFDCVDVDLEANTKISHLWIVPASGGESRRLNETTNHEERPRFSPDGKRLIWTSKATDPTQIWMCDFDPEAGQLVGQPYQFTGISTGADGAIWSPDGKNIVFVSSVYPDAKNDIENRERDEALKKSKVKAKVFTRLLYRHWNAYSEFKRSHLFVLPADCNPPSARAECMLRDLTPGDHDVPPFNLGGQDMYAISPDGQELAYTSNIDEVEATSTNDEIFVVPMSGGAPKKISISPGADTTPLYSPDGKYIAWRSQARAGFEADKWRLVVQDRQSGKTRDATEHFDRSVGSYVWDLSGLLIYFSYETSGQAVFGQIAIDMWNEGKDAVVIPPTEAVSPRRRGQPASRYLHNFEVHIDDGHMDDFAAVSDGLFYTRNFASAPSEIWRQRWNLNDPAHAPKQITHMDDALLSQINMQPLEAFTFKGANDAEVQGFMIKPPGFDQAKKYPLKFLIHGGPQGAWGNSWTYRWNAELFAAPSSQSVGRDSVEPKSDTPPSGSTESSPTKAKSLNANGATDGYVVVMINFHGSTGYGQKFTDSISGDWGGKPYVDLMKGLDYVEKTYPFIDKNREAALGASYGGYMANWILGHTNRFKCIVSHDGTMNTETSWGTTEELWFAEWEFKGPPWKQRELYRKFSPHLFADKFRTPTLVVHGQNDYRLDVSQGFDLFTTLQRLKVPSKMLYFPDEGHWVLKPQNSRLWYKTVNDWVDQWCGKAR